MNKQLHFLPFASLPEVPRGNGIVNYLVAGKEVGARAMHTGISKLPVGVTAPRHSHNAEEQVTVLEGMVKITLDDREQICRRFDSTFISAGVEHELVNVGDAAAYVLGGLWLAGCGPHLRRDGPDGGHRLRRRSLCALRLQDTARRRHRVAR